MGKKYTAILVLSLLLVHLAGFYVYFVVRLGEVRMEMRKKLADMPETRLEVITIPRESFKASWLEELEMKWQGRMYDIARVEVSMETVRVFCLHDEDEDGLVSFISSVIETSRQDKKETPGTVIQFFSLKYVTAQILIPTLEIKRLVSNETAYRVVSGTYTSDPVSPPPRS